MVLRVLFLSSGILAVVVALVAAAVEISSDIDANSLRTETVNEAGLQRTLVVSLVNNLFNVRELETADEFLETRQQLRVEVQRLSDIRHSLYRGGKLADTLPDFTRARVQDHYDNRLEKSFLNFFTAMAVLESRLSTHIKTFHGVSSPPDNGGGAGTGFVPAGQHLHGDDPQLASAIHNVEQVMFNGFLFDLNTSVEIVEDGISESIGETGTLVHNWGLRIMVAFGYLIVTLFFTQYRPARNVAGRLARLNKNLDEKVERRTSQLKQERENLKTVLDSALDGIMSIAPDNTVTVFNPAAERIFGYSAKEIIGKSVTNLVSPVTGDLRSLATRRASESGERAGFDNRLEVQGLRKDGTFIPIELSVSEASADEAKSFTTVVRDITERKENEDTLRKAVEQATAANEAKSAFLATMSHELRTPLNAIIGFSDLLKHTGVDRMEDSQVEFVDTINRAGKHLLGLINDVLDISRIEAGQAEIHRTEFDAQELIDETLQEMGVLAHAADVRISFTPDGLDHPLMGDKVKLRQVLVNTIANAIKFSKAGGMISVRASVLKNGELISSESGVLHVTVLDNGIGFDPADSERLFESFYQADSSLAREREGTGLGLPLSRRLVRLQHGDMVINSQGEGKGARVVIEIPMERVTTGKRKDESHTKEQVDVAASGDGDPGEPPVILVVDDQEDGRKLVSETLKPHGFTIAEAKTGSEVMDRAIELSPYGIILDLLLPGKDGFEVLEELQNDPRTKNIPVVVLTAKSLTVEEIEILNRGGHAFLIKSTETLKLTELIPWIRSSQDNNERLRRSA